MRWTEGVESWPRDAGFVVMRYLASSTAKDVRRYRLFEKALDALATSPYARGVTRWIFAGGLSVCPQPCIMLFEVLRLIVCTRSSWTCTCMHRSR